MILSLRVNLRRVRQFNRIGFYALCAILVTLRRAQRRSAVLYDRQRCSPQASACVLFFPLHYYPLGCFIVCACIANAVFPLYRSSLELLALRLWF